MTPFEICAGWKVIAVDSPRKDPNIAPGRLRVFLNTHESRKGATVRVMTEGAYRALKEVSQYWVRIGKERARNDFTGTLQG